MQAGSSASIRHLSEPRCSGISEQTRRSREAVVIPGDPDRHRQDGGEAARREDDEVAAASGGMEGEAFLHEKRASFLSMSSAPRLQGGEAGKIIPEKDDRVIKSGNPPSPPYSVECRF